MMSEQKKCDINLKLDEKGDWKLELSGDCGKTIQQIESLAERRGRYLSRRIKVVD